MADLELALHRDVFTLTTTMGVLTVDGKSFGYTVEDEDRGLAQGMALADLTRIKVPGETAIPVGRYQVRKTWSNRFGRDMLEVLDVPGFRGIRIHAGVSEASTRGCICPGLGRSISALEIQRSARAVAWLEGEYDRRTAAGDTCWITVSRAEAPWAAYNKRVVA